MYNTIVIQILVLSILDFGYHNKLCRYDIMNCCWKELPQDRPTFSMLIARLSKCLISVADYLSLESINNYSDIVAS